MDVYRGSDAVRQISRRREEPRIAELHDPSIKVLRGIVFDGDSDAYARIHQMRAARLHRCSVEMPISLEMWLTCVFICRRFQR